MIRSHYEKPLFSTLRRKCMEGLLHLLWPIFMIFYASLFFFPLILAKFREKLKIGTLFSNPPPILTVEEHDEKYCSKALRERLDQYGPHRFIKLKNGLTFHYVCPNEEVTKGTKPLMLFVHGFPECWYTWRYQLKAFQDDYYVVAIDTRGYGLSSKPKARKEYSLYHLTNDIKELVAALGYKKCCLVTHDWGSVIGLAVGHLFPSLLSELIVLNCLHPLTLLGEDDMSIGEFGTQLFMSWYIFFFQAPWVPEMLLSAGNYSYIKACFLGKKMGLKNKENMSETDIKIFRYMFSKPHVDTCAINYYRNLLTNSPYTTEITPDTPIKETLPVLFLFGEEDGALSVKLTKYTYKYINNLKLITVPNASHWVQQDQPKLVNQYIKEWLALISKRE